MGLQLPVTIASDIAPPFTEKIILIDLVIALCDT